jgi:selenocysteine lyase/cysteine desulfurase
VVAVPHASNVTGDVYDAATVVAKVKASCPGALVIVDGVAYAPHRRADAAGLEADCYVCAFHKAFGPHLAAAALSSRLIDRVAHFPAPGAGARAFEVGTVSAEACAGVAALRSYVEAAAADLRPCGALDDALDAFYEGVALAEAAPLARLLAFLDAAPRATVLRGAGAVDKLPTVAFSHANLAPAAVVAEARNHKIALRCGDFLSPRLLDAVLPADARPAGVVRVSLAHYNTVAEVDRLCAALERMEKW